MAGKNYLERIAIVGAGGNSGRYMVEELLKTGRHKVSAITRADSTTALPEGVEVKKVDYDDHSSLVRALEGQDALVITLSAFAPEDQQNKLIDAAGEANVKWILPNEWSSASGDEQLAREALVPKLIAARKYLNDVGKSSWIAVSTGFWYEWSLSIAPAFGFDFKSREVTMFDDGETRINVSTWPQVGRAVASLLSLKIAPESKADKSPCLEQFDKGIVFVSSFLVSQKDMFDSVLRVTQTDAKDWTISYEPSQDRYNRGLKEMKNGDRLGFARALYSRIFFPDGSGNFQESHGLANDLLGLPKENIDEFTKIGIKKSENPPF